MIKIQIKDNEVSDVEKKHKGRWGFPTAAAPPSHQQPANQRVLPKQLALGGAMAGTPSDGDPHPRGSALRLRGGKSIVCTVTSKFSASHLPAVAGASTSLSMMAVQKGSRARCRGQTAAAALSAL